MKIVGRENVDYLSHKTGRQVTGIKLYCTAEPYIYSDRVEGLTTCDIFISSRLENYEDIKKLPIGSEIRCSYNSWGNIESVQACK